METPFESDVASTKNVESIRSKGVLKPITKEIYKPVLAELAENGYKFEHKTKVI